MVDIKKSFLLSIIGHVILVTLFFVSTKLNFKPEDPIEVKQVLDVVRVDIVGMPKYTLKELANIPKPKNAPATKKLDKKVKQKSFTSFIKETASKDVIAIKGKKKSAKKKTKTSDNGNDVDSKELKELIYEGNKLSKGLLRFGKLSEEELSALDSYALELTSLVKRFWQLPERLLKLELRCRVRVYIDSTGNIIKKEMYQSSGNDDYDLRALNSIDEAAPFPKPEQEIEELVKNGRIILGFPI